MALRIYPIRPLRGRGYYGQQGTPAAAFSGGEAMGKMAGNAMLEFQKWQAQQKLKQQQDAQNALANQLENTVTPPRAGAVGPVVNPATGQVTGNITPTVGTAPFSAGAAGMKLQQDFIRSQLENQRLAMELRNQGIASNLAARRGGGGGGGGGNASRWQQYLGGGRQVDQFGNPVKAGKPAAYQPNSSTPNDPAYYDFNHQRADIDAQYGKGTYDRILANAGNITVDPKTGKYAVKTDPNDIDPDTGKPKPVTSDVRVDPDTGAVTLKSTAGHPGASIPYNEIQDNMKRYDATLVRQGKDPRFNDQYLGTQNPQSGLPNGDTANPYMPKSTLELQTVPPGKWFVNPQDGRPYQKQAPGQPATQQPPAAQKTSQVDTGPTSSQQVASAGPQPQTQPPPLLSLSSGQPQTPQQGLTSGDSGQGQDYTGGQPQLSQLSPVTPQAPVDLAAVSGANTPSSFNLGQPTSGGLPQDQQLADEIKRTQMANYLQGVA
jgi:hypothetical protein